ncbi:MAG TPA: hypothetical protein VK870_01025, partial [Ignavibacteriaceae bacterium]|nr:hypothetical protein [Ignavibacteriaceae bacterium]
SRNNDEKKHLFEITVDVYHTKVSVTKELKIIIYNMFLRTEYCKRDNMKSADSLIHLLRIFDNFT